MTFSAVELAIISVMRRNPRHWYSTNELADRTKIAWETANEALESLHEEGYLVKGQRGSKRKHRVYWRLYL